tara:strand:- start:1330 stop:2643 length:1314 start_codon:yes stop_codon:yes gene_type:complete
VKMKRNILSMNKVSVRLRSGWRLTAPLCLAFCLVVLGMAHIAFLAAAAVAGIFAFYLWRRSKSSALSLATGEKNHLSQINPVDERELARPVIKIGYGLFPLVENKKGAPLIGRVDGIRQQLSGQLGFALPHIPIKVDLSLEPNSYRILMGEMILAEDLVWPEDALALDDGSVVSAIAGRSCKDPAFGMDALWIDQNEQSRAVSEGYLVVDASTVIATHLGSVVRGNAARLFSSDDAQRLIDCLKTSAPQLADSLTSGWLSLNAMTAICQELLAENVPLNDFQKIATAMLEASSMHGEIVHMVETIRQEIGDLIVHAIVPKSLPLTVVTLDASLESALFKSFKVREGAVYPFDLLLAQKMIEAVNIAVRSVPVESRNMTLIASPVLRRPLSALLRPRFPDLSILSYQELPEDKSIEVLTNIGVPLSSRTMAVTDSNSV